MPVFRRRAFSVSCLTFWVQIVRNGSVSITGIVEFKVAPLAVFVLPDRTDDGAGLAGKRLKRRLPQGTKVILLIGAVLLAIVGTMLWNTPPSAMQKRLNIFS